jgi:hypothetical protein
MFYNSCDSFHPDPQSPRGKTHFQSLDPIDEKAMLERYFLEQKQQLIMMQQVTTINTSLFLESLPFLYSTCISNMGLLS